MLRKGSVWGEDIVLQNSGLHLELPAISVRYSSVFVIDATELLETIDKYAEFKERFRIVRIYSHCGPLKRIDIGRGVHDNILRTSCIACEAAESKEK